MHSDHSHVKCMFITLIFNYMYVNVCGYVFMCVDTCRGQKMAPDSFKLELQVAVSHLLWVVGTEFEFSGKAASSLDHLEPPPPCTECLFISIGGPQAW